MDEFTIKVIGQIIEFFLNIPAFWLSVKFLQALYKTNLFLTNQKYYVGTIVLSGIVTVVTKVFLRIQEHFIKYPDLVSLLLGYVHNLADSVILNMLIQIMIFVDCFYSTVQPNDIRKETTISICVLLSVISFFHQRLGEGAMTFALLGFLNFICWLTVIGLILIGRFRYKHQAVGDIKEKYRIVVSLRTLAVLKPLAILSALRNFILDTTLLLLHLEVTPKNTAVGFIYAYTMTFYTLFCPIVMIKNHDELKKIFGIYRQVEDSVSTKASVTQEDKFIPKNVVGECLRVPNERDHHFKQITSNWNAMAVQRESTIHTVTVIDL
ncbi:unnamed protein product [Bursaphelenchus xylophilus]|uniref:(pine wood nematode) hypothetical protein n=1 Tax=Bursaphelenchus xylophilus TaxID=6326 RepID=A0A1I7RYW9_BURXY|nr:unnamed protein product [Bursaphelenchus xylophilus]CAG9092111.1 unnamed protein product [Bursaphelenchus xylophilus]